MDTLGSNESLGEEIIDSLFETRGEVHEVCALGVGGGHSVQPAPFQNPGVLRGCPTDSLVGIGHP